MQPRGRQASVGVMALLVVALSMAGGSSGLPALETGPRPTRADSRDLPAPPTGTLAALPLQRPSDVVNAPTGYMGRTLQVNPGVGQRVRSIPVVREHGNVRVSYGRVANGVGAGELIDYLTAEAEGRGGNPLRPFRPIQTVRVVEGATPEMIDQTVRAVQLINASLPREWRLRFDESLVPRQFADSLGVVRCEDFVCETTKIPVGDIIVQYEAAEVWLKKEIAEGEPHPSGRAEFNWSVRSLGARTLSYWAGRVWVDPARVTGEERVHVLVHEILHVLGRDHADPERFPDSVMRPLYTSARTGEILHPLDREALLAVYGVLSPFASGEEVRQALKFWEATSTRVRGELRAGGGEVAFGVGLRNGLARPWASGPGPLANAAADPSLSRILTWSGRLVGFASGKEVVEGAAELTLRLDTLDGTLFLSGLESWPEGQPPGAANRTTPWGEADVRYHVSLRGNSFVAMGDVAGEVTGVLFGDSHAGMGGVVTRDGLTAAFGGAIDGRLPKRAAHPARGNTRENP